MSRFNWDAWDTFDANRTDSIDCPSDPLPSLSGSPVVSIPLVGCELNIPPRIESFNIYKTSQIEIFIHNN